MSLVEGQYIQNSGGSIPFLALERAERLHFTCKVIGKAQCSTIFGMAGE